MKKLFLFVVLFISGKIFSQDTIHFRNGQITQVKVSEIGVNDIHYTRKDNPDGPKYIVEKNDVLFIKYAGGQTDSFAVRKPEIKNTSPESFAIKGQEDFPRPSVSCDKIIISRNDLFCNNRRIGEKALNDIILNLPEGNKKNLMRSTYAGMKKCKSNQYVWGFTGLGVGIVGAYMGGISGILLIFGETPPPVFVAGFVLGGGYGILGAVRSAQYKKHRNILKLKLAKLYNE